MDCFSIETVHSLIQFYPTLLRGILGKGVKHLNCYPIGLIRHILRICTNPFRVFRLLCTYDYSFKLVVNEQIKYGVSKLKRFFNIFVRRQTYRIVSFFPFIIPNSYVALESYFVHHFSTFGHR
jgi:hypothetical protein